MAQMSFAGFARFSGKFLEHRLLLLPGEAQKGDIIVSVIIPDEAIRDRREL
jgi:hypothetical protein